MGVRRRELLAATPAVVLLPGCVSIGSPSRGFLEFTTESRERYRVDVVVSGRGTTVHSETATFDSGESATVSFQLPEAGSADIEVEFETDLRRLELVDDVDEGAWSLTGSTVRGRVEANSSDQQYRFRVDDGAVRLDRDAVHAV